MGNLLRFGLIGCGSQGRYLAEALMLAGGAECVACADISGDALAQAVEQCGFRTTFNDYSDMLNDAPLDAVIVATTHDQLQPAAMAVVAAGRHVFVEKPMALTAESGRELVAAARKAGVKLMVDYTMRFMPARVQMKRLLDEGAIGDIAHVTAGQLIGSMSGGWLGDPARGGGPLLYIGTHVLDQVLWVVNRPVERVYAEVDRASEAEIEKDALITIKFEGGAVAQVTCSSKLGGRYGWLDLFGSEGRMHAEWENHRLSIESKVLKEYQHLTHIEVPGDANMPAVNSSRQVSLVTHFYIRAWASVMAEFVTAINEDRDPAVTGEDGVRVLEVTDAVFESGRTGGPVEVRS